MLNGVAAGFACRDITVNSHYVGGVYLAIVSDVEIRLVALVVLRLEIAALPIIYGVVFVDGLAEKGVVECFRKCLYAGIFYGAYALKGLTVLQNLIADVKFTQRQLSKVAATGCQTFDIRGTGEREGREIERAHSLAVDEHQGEVCCPVRIEVLQSAHVGEVRTILNQ